MARDVTSARERGGETEAWEARSVLFSSDGLVAAVALDAVQRALAQGEPVDAPCDDNTHAMMEVEVLGVLERT